MAGHVLLEMKEGEKSGMLWKFTLQVIAQKKKLKLVGQWIGFHQMWMFGTIMLESGEKQRTV